MVAPKNLRIPFQTLLPILEPLAAILDPPCIQSGVFKVHFKGIIESKKSFKLIEELITHGLTSFQTLWAILIGSSR